MVDMGIVLCENILVRLKNPPEGENRLESIYEASVEVSSAITTAVLTTVVSFLPVFALQAAEGRLFKPLAYTKTFSLVGALFVALLLVPPAAHLLFRSWKKNKNWLKSFAIIEMLIGLYLLTLFFLPGLILIALGAYSLSEDRLHRSFPKLGEYKWMIVPAAVFLFVLYFLSESWRPLGVESNLFINILIVGLLIGVALWGFRIFQGAYPRMLSWCLKNKLLFLSLPFGLVLCGTLIWSRMGEEFMPSLDEGSFLYMPTTMPHASIGEAKDSLQQLDLAISSVPEVELVVGKLGRADTSLDPAPISMFENIINYKSEYMLDHNGKPLRFRFDSKANEFAKDKSGNLIEDDDGKPYRQWRDHINSTDDIWNEIVNVAKIPGLTSAPKLQPIAARIVMLQSGMRAPMGIKVRGSTLEQIDKAGQQIEKFLKEVPSIEPAAVIADRVIGKPYLEIDINRKEIARYGLTIRNVQDVIEVAIGGKPLTMTVEGRERYPVRIRYQRELRGDLESLGDTLIPTPRGQHIPLRELAEINFSRQAQVIKSEDTFLTSYVVFDKKSGFAEVEVVEQAKKYLEEKIAAGELILPQGVNYTFAGSYENQLRAKKRLALVLPVTLFAIFLILYLQFRSVPVTFIIFSGIFVAWSGGFIMLWLYAQDWFLNFSLFDLNLRELFQVKQFNLSVAVWVGFIALFGIATDDGVLMATYIKQKFELNKPRSIESIRESIIEAASKRIRPALMTTATTLLALLPVITSKGRGSDIMVPMAVPSFGGMLVAITTVFVVPVLYCALAEKILKMEETKDE
jgi:Cu(I)/Ag(I) efflux system membrane protein CusA/SilA